MKKFRHLLLAFVIVACLGSCKSDPSGPDADGTLILTTLQDSTPVDVGGIWKLISNSQSDIRLSLSSGGARFYSGNELIFSAEDISSRPIITKSNGVEHVRLLYDLLFADRTGGHLLMAVITNDSLLVNDCNSDLDIQTLIGSYTRVK